MNGQCQYICDMDKYSQFGKTHEDETFIVIIQRIMKLRDNFSLNVLPYYMKITYRMTNYVNVLHIEEIIQYALIFIKKNYCIFKNCGRKVSLVERPGSS